MEGFGGVDYCVDGAEVVCCLMGKLDSGSFKGMELGMLTALIEPVSCAAGRLWVDQCSCHCHGCRRIEGARYSSLFSVALD